MINVIQTLKFHLLTSPTIKVSSNEYCQIAHEIWIEGTSYEVSKKQFGFVNDWTIASEICDDVSEDEHDWVNALTECSLYIEKAANLPPGTVVNPMLLLVDGTCIPGTDCFKREYKGGFCDGDFSQLGTGFSGLAELMVQGANLTNFYELDILFFNMTDV